jgi:unsaturated chondroitin disaccharide hydrolase
MMNLQLLYLATRLTSNQNYTRIADIHAENTARILIRPDWGTYHVVNIDPNTGEIVRKFQQQGWKDESTWSRGQGWGVTGYADSALWTGNEKYIE